MYSSLCDILSTYQYIQPCLSVMNLSAYYKCNILYYALLILNKEEK
jgi:hypothetical protein